MLILRPTYLAIKQTETVLLCTLVQEKERIARANSWAGFQLGISAPVQRQYLAILRSLSYRINFPHLV
jgi:hypothetical protein